jgi:hypothetical protein
MSSRRIYQSALLAVGVVAALAVWAAPASAVQHLPLETFGSTEQPTFGAVKAVAVDQATGDVLIADGATNSILRYHADGTPAPFSDLGSNEIDGFGPGDETPEVPAGKHGEGEKGLTFAAASKETEIAVDNSGGQASGDIYVTQSGRHLAFIFSSSGEFLGQLDEAFEAAQPEPFDPSEEGKELGEICGVAVDGSGNVYLGDFRGEIHKFAPSVNPPSLTDNTANLKGLPHICNVAAGTGSSGGKLFAAEYGNGSPVFAFDAATGVLQFPLTRSSNGNISIDPTGGHVYIGSGEEVDEYAGGSTTQPISSIPAPSSVQASAVDGGSRAVYVASAGSPTLELSPAGPLVPGVGDQSVREALTNEATVEATINPEGTAASYFVEYGPTASYGSASSNAALPADNADHRVSVRLRGLSPGTEYHFRFLATNAVGTSLGVDRTLSTFRVAPGGDGCANFSFRQGPSARLADCRAYEMVTPVDKNNTDIVGLINVSSQIAMLDQSALSGDQLTYTTSQGFGDTQGAPYVSQYIASRTPDGWTSGSITPSQGVSQQNPGNRLDLEYSLFSPDLCQGLLLHWTDPPLAPGAVEGVPNIYRHTLCGTTGYETLTTMAHGERNPNVQGLSDDGRCSLFAIPGSNLYETCAGHTQVVNVLPDGVSSSVAVAGTGYVNENSELNLRANNSRGAVSADGSRIYFTPGQGPGPLYLRLDAQAEQSGLGPGNECTEPLKACTVPVSEGEQSIFWGASSDGSRAFYSTAGGESDLYEFDLATQSSTFIAGEITGVMGVDREATRIYFSSREAIGGEGMAGKPNLYLFDSTKSGAARFRLIGTLTESDGMLETNNRYSLANIQPHRRVARISADGLHAVFAAYASLTGYDNTDQVSGEADLEVFVYDATADGGAGALDCVSCNPTGQPPVGRNVGLENSAGGNWTAASIPGYATSFYGSRVISTTGNRVFFDSYEALVPADTNGKEDVYEWEASGSGGPDGGGCSESSPSFSPRNGGCLSLISPGESSSDSEFVDASPDGRDVFFSTASSLVPQDPGLIDIYDAREGGGFPPPPGLAPTCEGEACQGPVSPPNDQTPASASFRGPGNVVECAKGKVKKKNGKCVAKKSSTKKHHKKKHHKKKHHQARKVGGEGRANDNRRAGR